MQSRCQKPTANPPRTARQGPGNDLDVVREEKIQSAKSDNFMNLDETKTSHANNTSDTFNNLDVLELERQEQLVQEARYLERKEKEPFCRELSLFKSVIKASPLDAEQCTQEQFLTHLYGADVESVVATDNLNASYLDWMGKPNYKYSFFNPITIPRRHERLPYGTRLTQGDLLLKGNLKYAAFEVSSEEMPELFTLEVETDGYPIAAIISVERAIVHVLFKVDAQSVEQYKDRCELIYRVADDVDGCSRSASQIDFCTMPDVKMRNLLYLNPEVAWNLPVPTKDFA